MIHAKATKPRIFPWNNDSAPAQIDRAQDIGGDLTLNREKMYEIGRDGLLGYRAQTPDFAYSMTQFEYGSMDFWRKLANREDPGSGDAHYVTLENVKATFFDIAAYLTDDSGTFKGTIWFPRLRVNGFGLNIGDPDAIVERTFDLVGEDYKILDGKYFAYQEEVAATATETVTLSPAPVEWASGDYVFRVLRVRTGVLSELEEGTGTNQWSYAAGDVTVRDCQVGDLVKVYYPASTAYTTLWADNDSDSKILTADSCEIFMKVGTSQRVYRLQSVGIDVAFDRADYKEIGNANVVQTGVTAKTVTVTLGRLLENFTIEEVLASDTTYPFIDPRQFSDEIQIMVKIYSDSTKTSFKMGYLMDNLSPTTLGSSHAVEDYGQFNNALECDNLKISDLESEIAFA